MTGTQEKLLTAEDSVQPNRSKELTKIGTSAIQGGKDDGHAEIGIENPPVKLDIKASEFKPDTYAALESQGLTDPDEVLRDETGKKAEATALTVLKYEGIPDGNQDRLGLKNIIPGHFDDQGHGIDLIGITDDGRPIPIEIKKRQDPSHDSMGEGVVPLERMEPETLAMKVDLLHEREVNPPLRTSHEGRQVGDPDQELSTNQMGWLWTRDRWLKLIKNEERKEELSQAGVGDEYLDLNNFKYAHSPHWRKILDGRTTVIVSTEKNTVTNKLKDQALFERGCNVVGIDLKS
jgi:hypothetical protein